METSERKKTHTFILKKGKRSIASKFENFVILENHHSFHVWNVCVFDGVDICLSGLKIQSKFRFWIRCMHNCCAHFIPTATAAAHFIWRIPTESGSLKIQIMIGDSMSIFQKAFDDAVASCELYIFIYLLRHAYGFTLFECILSALTLAKQIHFQRMNFQTLIQIHGMCTRYVCC